MTRGGDGFISELSKATQVILSNQECQQNANEDAHIFLSL